jgi:xylan 1,4-beta-xylosidase
VWDWQQPQQAVSDRPFFTRVLPAKDAPAVRLAFAGLKPGSYRLEVRRTGFRNNDPQTAWLEMGSPAALSPAQQARLQTLTRDLPESSRIVGVASSGRFSLTLPMRSNDVVLVTMERARR